jgi:hypothetical protein
MRENSLFRPPPIDKDGASVKWGKAPNWTLKVNGILLGRRTGKNDCLSQSTVDDRTVKFKHEFMTNSSSYA